MVFVLENHPFNVWRLVSAIFLTLLVVYLVYHLLQGDRSVFSLREFQGKVAELDTQIALLEIEKNKIEKQIKLLNPTSLDLDFLEERVRVVLGFVHPDDWVVILPPSLRLKE